jgi:predicted secreted protein
MATSKKAAVAGSVQGPAVAEPALIAPAPKDPAPAKVVAEPFPREVVIANDTPISRIVAATFIAPGAKVPVVVRNQDEITRIETDIKHLIELNPEFAELEEKPLRVIDAAAEK